MSLCNVFIALFVSDKIAPTLFPESEPVSRSAGADPVMYLLLPSVHTLVRTLNVALSVLLETFIAIFNTSAGVFVCLASLFLTFLCLDGLFITLIYMCTIFVFIAIIKSSSKICFLLFG